jgi:hypothetical protein
MSDGPAAARAASTPGAPGSPQSPDATAGAGAANPIDDIVLMPFVARSGSTFLSDQLSRHPEICVCPEAEILARLLWPLPAGRVLPERRRLTGAITSAIRHDDKLSWWGLDPEKTVSPEGLPSLFRDGASGADVMYDVLRAYRDQVVPGASRILYKCAYHLLLPASGQTSRADALEGVASVRWLGIMRDGRACYASQKRAVRPRTGRPMQVSPIHAARDWVRYARGLEELGRQVPRLNIANYEMLIRDIEPQLIAIREWLGIGAEAIDADAGPGMTPAKHVGLADRIPHAQRHLHPNLSKAPETIRIDGWKTSLAPIEIALYEREAGPELLRQGYRLTAPGASRIRLAATAARYHLTERWHRTAARVSRAYRIVKHLDRRR